MIVNIGGRDVSGPFQYLEGWPGNADETLAGTSCIVLLLTAFTQDFFPFQTLVPLSPLVGSIPHLFDNFPWKRLGCSLLLASKSPRRKYGKKLVPW